MKKTAIKTAVMALALGVALVTAGAARAQESGNHPFKCFKPFEMKAFVEELNLTQAQKDALENLKTATDAATKALREQIRAQQAQELQSALADPVDTATATTAFQALTPLKDQLAAANFQAKLKAVQILTPEQRKMVLEKITEIRNCVEESQQGSHTFMPLMHFFLDRR